MRLNLFKKTRSVLHPTHNTPKDIRKFFSTPQYRAELDELLKRTPEISEEIIDDFKNNYIRKNTIKTNSMDITLNHGQLLNGFEYIQELSLSPDDFYEGFASDIWNKLNFSERFTLLNWLRDNQSKNERPDIDVVSRLYNANTFMYYRNKIILPYRKNSSGIETAGGIIQNTHLINETTHPTSNGEIKINNTYVDLTNYFKQKNGKKKIMNINIDTLNEYDRQDVLRLKNLVVPVTSTPNIPINEMHEIKYLINTFHEFVHYLTHELHYTSPLVVDSLKKRSTELNALVNKKTFPESDIKAVESYSNTTHYASSYNIAPVLQTLNKTEREDLLDSTLRRRFLFATGQHKTMNYRYLNSTLTKQMQDIYNKLKNEKGELSRL